MQKSKLFLNVLFLTLLTSSATSLFGMAEAAATKAAPCNRFSLNCMRSKLPSKTTSLVGAALATWYMLYSRESVTDFQTRFNRDTLLNVKNVVSKDYWKNVWYLISDEFIGQVHKSKSIKLDAEGENRLQVRKGDCPPYGVCGKIDTMFKTFMKSTESARNLLLTAVVAKHSGVLGVLDGVKAKQPEVTVSSRLANQ